MTNKIETLHGWQFEGTIADNEIYWNDDREMMLVTTPTKTTLSKENSLSLEFTGPAHFFNAVKKSDELYSAYADLH